MGADISQRAAERQWRVAGTLLVTGSLLQLATAALPNFRVFMSPDPSVQIEAIARGRQRWNAQAVGFPAAFAIVSAGMAVSTSAMADRPARTSARVAAAMSAAATCLWLPIAVRRLQLGRAIDRLAAERPTPRIDIGGPTFWPYTYASLASLFLMGCALVLTRGQRRFGIVIGAVIVGALALSRRLHDWPPFLTYLMTLAIGLRMRRTHRS